MSFELPCECGHRLAVTTGDAGAVLWCECGRRVQVPGLRELRMLAPTPVEDSPWPRRQPPARSAQLTGVDVVICVLLPAVGFIAGLLRLLRGEPTAGRML